MAREIELQAFIPDIGWMLEVAQIEFGKRVLCWDHPCPKTAKIKNRIAWFRLGDGVIIRQSSGKLDNKGKKIFDGDIVKWGENIETVKYDESEASFQTETSCLCSETMEVIGNIYQNPELLKPAENNGE